MLYTSPQPRRCPIHSNPSVPSHRGTVSIWDVIFRRHWSCRVLQGIAGYWRKQMSSGCRKEGGVKRHQVHSSDQFAKSNLVLRTKYFFSWSQTLFCTIQIPFRTTQNTFLHNPKTFSYDQNTFLHDRKYVFAQSKILFCTIQNAFSHKPKYPFLIIQNIFSHNSELFWSGSQILFSHNLKALSFDSKYLIT